MSLPVRMPVQIQGNRNLTTPGVRADGGGLVGMGIGLNFSKLLKFYCKVFYLMGKALSGKLSCVWTGLVVFACILMGIKSPRK